MGVAEPIHASQTLQLLAIYVLHDFDHDVTQELERDSTAASSVLQICQRICECEYAQIR